MKRSFSKILNISSLLFSVYKNQGSEKFLHDLKGTLGFIVHSYQDNPEEINKRFASLTSCFLSQLLNNDARYVLKQQSVICEKAIKEKNNQEKISLMVKEFDDFLKHYEGLNERLSESVITFLKSLDISDFKMLSVDYLAEEFGYSTAHLSRKFSEEQGITLHEAIVYEKLNRAFKILKEDKTISVAVLTNLLGFSEPKYFGKLFKEKFGFTPGSLLKQS